MRSVSRYCLALVLIILSLSTAASAQPPAAHLSPAEAKAQYVQAIQRHVQDNWAYKKTLDNQFYSIQATIILDKDGIIVGRTIDKISPDKEFNISAVKQLAMMEPFPPIPEELQLDEYEIRFHLMPNKH